MKVVIIGGVAGGASTAARLRRLDETAEIIILERGEDVSFANCGIPYYCGDIIKDFDNLKILTPKAMKNLLNIDVRIKNEVISINKENKTITILDLKTNNKYQENYDKLVLSPGAAPIIPNIEGITDARIFTVRNLENAENIKNYIKNNKPKKAVVIGAGFIGLEMAENLHHQGLEVTIIEKSPQILNQVDYEIAAQLQNHLTAKGINLCLNDGVTSFKTDENLIINLESGKQISTDMIILSIGVRPENYLAKSANLDLGKIGGILVNQNLQTSDENIYALGDAIEVTDAINNAKALIPLAGIANKQGRIVAENLVGINSTFQNTYATAIVKVFDYTVAITGNNEKQLTKNNIQFNKVYIQGSSHASYYPQSYPVDVKLLFSPNNGKILGAQILGIEGVDKRIDVISACLKNKNTIKDLIDLELSYAPPFGSAKDPINVAGMMAENILTGKVKPIYWNEIEKLLNDSFILDVRTDEERMIGSIEKSTHIPIEELRTRLNELPKDKRIIIYCTKGKKAYYASRILMLNGFDNIYNLDGGYSLYKKITKTSLEKKVTKTVQNNFNEKLNSNSLKYIEIDACGLSCPGPIVKLAKEIEKINIGELIKIKTTDPGFFADVDGWAKSSGNTLLEINEADKVINALVQKGTKTQSNNINNTKNDKTIVVFSQDLDKIMASFIIANGAAASGKKVTMFFTFWGLNSLRKDSNQKIKKSLLDNMFGLMMPKGVEKLALSNLNMFGLGTLMMKYVMKKKNVFSLKALIEQAESLNVKFIACQMSMDVMGLKKEELLDSVEIAGVASYINAAENSDMNLFI